MKYNGIIIVLFLMIISAGCSNSNRNNVPIEETIVNKSEKIHPGYNIWEYKTSIDEMDDTKVHFAHLRSEDSKDLGFVDESKMHIIIRHREDDKDQVFLNVDFGTFDVDNRSGEANVRVRFGKEAPMTFKVRSLIGDDKSSVGILKSSKFIELPQNTDTLLIEAPFFKRTNQVFKFTTNEPLHWEN